MILDKKFDDIDETTLRELVDAGATETVYLEFKRETYGNSDNDKKELLKDISSFANALGGQLIIGIEEDDGAASNVVPITGIDIDQELLRLENVARTGIEPKIIGLRMKRVQVEDGSAILINVPRSFDPPHRVIFKNNNRYYARSSSGTYELSLEELRMLFGQQRTIEERTTAFVNERFLRIQANDGVISLPVQQGAMVMHLVPLPDFGTRRRHEIAKLREHASLFCPIAHNGYSSHINLDGVVVYGGGALHDKYTQVFRDGSVEAASASVFVEREGKKLFPSIKLPETIIQSLSSYMKGLKVIEASTPAMLQISFFGMRDVQIGVDPYYYSDPPPPYAHAELHLPPTVVSDYSDDDRYENVVAEQMNFLWNAYGFERCNYFDEQGNWVGKH